MANQQREVRVTVYARAAVGITDAAKTALPREIVGDLDVLQVVCRTHRHGCGKQQHDQGKGPGDYRSHGFPPDLDGLIHKTAAGRNTGRQLDEIAACERQAA